MRVGRLAAALAVAVAATLVLSACTKKNEASSSGGSTSSAGASAAGGGSGGKVKVAFVPKLQGIPYFEAMNTGGQEAAEAMGNVQWLYQGPTQADAAAQADIPQPGPSGQCHARSACGTSAAARNAAASVSAGSGGLAGDRL